MDTNSTGVVCGIDDENCGTGNTYEPVLRPLVDGSAAENTPSLTIEEIIDKLSGVIEFSHLAQSLRTRIDIINTLEQGFNDISTKVVTDNSVMAQQLMGLRGDLTNAVAYINSQTTIQLTEREALVSSVNQLVASLGNDLSAAIQEESTVRAEQTGALFAEKTVKTDLAGNVSGYGLSSYVDKTGAVSDFRVAADRFSIAPPAYVSPTPPPYNQMHDGKVWVDTSGGGKGVTKWWNSSSNSWSLTPVAAAQPFMYLTTPQTLPDGTVVQPGLYVNNARITKLTADKIDTRGLTIKDAAGNILFGAGTPLNISSIQGLGTLATKNDVHIGSTVKFPDGTVLNKNDFVHRLSKINSGNIGTYIDGAAITNAYIGNAAVETLNIAGNAVTVPVTARYGNTIPGNGSGIRVAEASITLDAPGYVYAIFTANQTYGTGVRHSITVLYMGGQAITVGGEAVTTNICVSDAVYLSAGTHTINVDWLGTDAGVRIQQRTLFVMGVKR